MAAVAPARSLKTRKACPRIFLVLERDDIDDPAVGGEEGEKLATKLLFVDLFIEVINVEGRIGLCRGSGGHGEEMVVADSDCTHSSSSRYRRSGSGGMRGNV